MIVLEFNFVEKTRSSHSTFPLGFSILEPFGDVREISAPIRRGNWMKNEL